MACEQPGHLTQRPSGTRLADAFDGAIGLRAFLNQAIRATAYHFGLRISDCGLRISRLFRPRDVVARARAHAADLLDEIVKRLVARLRIELRGLDHEERRGVVM